MCNKTSQQKPQHVAVGGCRQRNYYVLILPHYDIFVNYVPQLAIATTRLAH